MVRIHPPLPNHGALAHLGERNVRNVEVAGSSPACSTGVVTCREDRQEGEALGIGSDDITKFLTSSLHPPGTFRPWQTPTDTETGPQWVVTRSTPLASGSCVTEGPNPSGSTVAHLRVCITNPCSQV